MEQSSAYFEPFAAAYVRGEAIRARMHNGYIRSLDTEINGRPFSLAPPLLDGSIWDLGQNAFDAILRAGRQAGLKLYRFKNTHTELPRVKHVLGFLRSIQPESLLDVGSGRGAFLWPFLHQFPYLALTSVDLLAHRVEFLQTVTLGGLNNLQALQADICALEEPAESYDAVTLLEVLEHIPDVQEAVRRAVHVAKRYVVVTVPSKPDDNPEHIHLLTKEKLTELFEKAGCKRLRFDGVPGYLILIAAKETAA
ncbi:MAG TPA: class I SAM-dependent methyltransferase [Candidatus Limiplasma sp.]|nr:class I SAM-dependent methyltransferase [Candidatus Limiplasma sp.]